MEIVIFYIPFPDEDSAKKAIHLLISERLIACGNVIQSTGIFYWNDGITNESEFIAILKTLAIHISQIDARITDLHPYEIPAILRWNVVANVEYYQWVKEQVS